MGVSGIDGVDDSGRLLVATREGCGCDLGRRGFYFEKRLRSRNRTFAGRSARRRMYQGNQ
jgi:hypothetical protein